MVATGLFSLVFLTLSAIMPFSYVEGHRQFNRRSDLEDFSPIWNSSYVVPLEGGNTCSAVEDCVSSLPIPTPGKILKLLTLARGVLTYDCSDTEATSQPTYVSENVELYDAAALLPFILNEDSFNELVPQFYDYDYSNLTNSTLNCVGTIYSNYDSTVVTLSNDESFTLKVDTTIDPPNNPSFNANWVYSETIDGAWQIYRVETYGGAIPAACGGHEGRFDLGFAAEYWFYHG